MYHRRQNTFDALIIIVDAERKRNVDCETIGEKADSDCSCGAGISFLSFLITYLAPGDPVRTMYAASGIVPSEEVIEQTREAMGLNRPVLVQYADWLWGCLHGDLGTSYAYNDPVSALLLHRLWPTLKLSIFAVILMLVVSVPVGMIQATHKNTILDYGLRGITFFGVSMPNSGWDCY